MKETLSTLALSVKRRATSTSPVMTLTTPGGRSASTMYRPSSMVVKGVRAEGSSTVVQPAARAAPIFEMARSRG